MEEKQFNDKLDILKHVSDIKLRLKDDITNDFVLAKLSEKDKEFIIEMTGNAYFSKRILEVIGRKGEQWNWDGEQYKKVKLSEREREEIKRIAETVFDSYMIKIYMTIVLNRNVDKNYLINVLSGYNEPEEEKEAKLSSEETKGVLAELLNDQSRKEK